MKDGILHMQMLIALFNKPYHIIKGGRYLPLLVILHLMFGCRFTAKVFWGVKQPQNENTESIKRYALRQFRSDADIIILKDTTSLISLFKQQSKIPYVRIYDKKGDLVAKTAEGSCDAFLKDFIPRYDRMGYQDRENLSNLANGDFDFITNLFVNLNKAPIGYDKVKDYDLTVVYFYGNFLGKVGKKLYKRIKGQITSSKLKILFLKANCDMQAEWYNNNQ